VCTEPKARAGLWHCPWEGEKSRREDRNSAEERWFESPLLQCHLGAITMHVTSNKNSRVYKLSPNLMRLKSWLKRHMVRHLEVNGSLPRILWEAKHQSAIGYDTISDITVENISVSHIVCIGINLTWFHHVKLLLIQEQHSNQLFRFEE